MRLLVEDTLSLDNECLHKHELWLTIVELGKQERKEWKPEPVPEAEIEPKAKAKTGQHKKLKYARHNSTKPTPL